MKKRFVSILLVAAMTASLAACNLTEYLTKRTF